MAKITVLTAVYNAEKYLTKCLDSLISQTLTDCQFICIDDCSTDSSLSILKQYAERDERFVIISLPNNQGQAIARNHGLEIAEGEYIAMLDADDWFANDTLEKAYEALTSNRADAAVLRLIQCYETEQDGEDDKAESCIMGNREEEEHMVEYPIKSDATEWSGKEAFMLSLDWSLHGLYVVRTSIHKAYPFDTTCKLYSDDNTTRLHYLHSGKVVRCDGRYFYRKHAESMTNACSIRRFDYMIANLSMKRQIENEVKKGSVDNDVVRVYEKHRWLNTVGCYWYYYLHHDEFTIDEQNEIEQLFASILSTINAGMLPWKLKMKIGYYPFKDYRLFSSVENFYFWLRALLSFPHHK